jgi:Family of unknown function (DUF6152)
MRRGIPAAVLLAVVVLGASLRAHHAIAAVYDSKRQVTIDGLVREFQFINPHPLMTVEVKANDGSLERWHLEMDNRSELAQVGVKNDTWLPGDRVIVTGSMSRTEARSLYVGRLERPADGLLYEQIGASPRIRQRSAR